MLEVKVVLHHAVTGEVREIANMTITNDGTGDPDRGNYDVRLSEESLHVPNGALAARVEGYPRSLPLSVWTLVCGAISSAFESEGGSDES